MDLYPGPLGDLFNGRTQVDRNGALTNTAI